jgi:hypothetical protein
MSKFEYNGSGDGERVDVTLSPEDAAMVDALLDHPETAELRLQGAGRDAASPMGEDHSGQEERRARVQKILRTLGSLPEPVAPADLLSRTLAMVKNDTLHLESHRRAATRRAAEENDGRGMYLSRRLSQLGAVAVAASILVAVLIPGVGMLRQKAYITACTSNLKDMQTGFAAYAATHSNNLPSLAMVDGKWLAHPHGHSNAANLIPLVQQNYAKATDLVCPGRGGAIVIDANTREISDADRGYSYANLFGPVRPTWDGRATNIVLADRNPMFGIGAVDDAQANSSNHRSQGTNVLAADGSVTFVTQPNVGPHGDNIWTVEEGTSYHHHYDGTEVAATTDDIFLSP